MNKPKYESSINKHESVSSQGNDANDICKNIDDYNPNKNRRIFFTFDDMVAGMLSKNKLRTIVTNFLLHKKTKHTSLVFIIQSLFCCTKKY